MPACRPIAPDFLKKAKGNCMGNRAFSDWLERINLEGMASGHYPAWVVDGDFFGSGGWYTTVVPVNCQSDKHDHLPGDSNYACQRALAHLIASVRQHYPQTYIFTCRPPHGPGRLVAEERGRVFHAPRIRHGRRQSWPRATKSATWSRTRVHRDFFPHYIDQPLLFPSRCAAANNPSTWPSEKLDYILLSALSSSPNQLYYMPTKSGIPDKDKAELRKWLDWGRKNIEYLKVRKDLPDWPAAGKVDGSAHIVGDRGLVFLFNPSKDRDGRVCIDRGEHRTERRRRLPNQPALSAGRASNRRALWPNGVLGRPRPVRGDPRHPARPIGGSLE